MNVQQFFAILWLGFATHAIAEVSIDETAFGNSLGGWTKRSKQAAEYPLSGSVYRTYKPEISPTPDGGLFVSIRIDHVRGWLSSDDHAILEVTVNPKGGIASAQSNIAIQGRSITSDVILGTARAGARVGVADHAVQVGTDLIADLSAKLLREKIVEAGRVSFPAAIRHNYNLLFRAIRDKQVPQEPSAPPAVPVVELDETGEPKHERIPAGAPAAGAGEPAKAADAAPQSSTPAPVPDTRKAPATPAAPELPKPASQESSKPSAEPDPAGRDADPLTIQPYE